jgi:hypothetical protein
MASATYLANPALVEIGTVDLTDMCTAATITVTREALEDTAFGSTSRTMVGGLYNNEVTLSLYMSYATSETYATLQPLVGTKVTVKIKPASGNESSTNPIQIITDCYLESLPVFNGALGTLSTIDITLVGGTYSVDVTPPGP